MIYCGVDGGQTSTKCVLGTETGELIGFGIGGPLVHLSSEGGTQRFQASIKTTIDDAWLGSSLGQSPIASLVVGATGVFEDTIESSTAVDLLSPLYTHSIIDVCSDALAALVGAHAGASGIMVISGTGTIAYGMTRNNPSTQRVVARAGGWGWPLGDAGSAYAIGRAGLRAALHASDGLGPETALQPMMLDHFQVVEPHDIKRLYFESTFGAAAFAALAPVVSEAASKEDEVAQAIIAMQGEALAKQALAVAKKLNFEADSKVQVAPVGGAFEHIQGLKEAMALALRASAGPTLPGLVTVPPRLPPQTGAYLMALQQHNQPITAELIAAVERWDLRS